MVARIVVVEHEPGCPPAGFGDWLSKAGASLMGVRPYAGEELPSDFDGLVVLGGSPNAHDDERAPWLPGVRELIRDTDRPVLGICLGHQLAAVALGGTSRPNPRGRALGVAEVEWTEVAADDPLLSGPQGAVGIFWNTDVVTDLPEGTVVLARAVTGEVQAARFADRVWGVQWHPEATAAIVRAWAEEDSPAGISATDEAALARIAAAETDQERFWGPLAERFVAECVRT